MKTEIEIPVADLKKVLPGLSKIIPKSTGLPVLRCVRVWVGPDQLLRLQATNLDEIATVTLGQCSPGCAGEMLVPCDELATLVKNSSGMESVRLLGTRTESSIRYTAAGTIMEKPFNRIALAEWPPIQEPEGEPSVLPDVFKQSLAEAMECSSVDGSRYVLQGACLDVTNKEAHYVVATDGHHLYSANSFLFDLPASLIVPARKFLLWPGFMADGGWKLRFEPENKKKKRDSWFQINSDHWSYVAKPIDGNYPNWKQVVATPDHKWTRIMLGEASVKTILEALPLLPGMQDEHQPVVLEVQQEQLILKAKAKDQKVWTAVPIVDATVTGQPVEVSLNRMYLGKAIRMGLTGIDLLNPVSPVLFGAKGRIIVVMPVHGEAARLFAAAHPPKPSPSENASAPPPSAAEPETPTEPESKTPMTESTMTAPPRGNLNGNGKTEAEPSAIDEVVKQIETLKTDLRKILEDINEADRLLRRAVKEQKVSEKEIIRARTALRSLQSLEI